MPTIDDLRAALRDRERYAGDTAVTQAVVLASVLGTPAISPTQGDAGTSVTRGAGRRRPPRTRTAVLVTIAAVIVVAAAVAVAVRSARHATRPTDPSVSAAQLRTYRWTSLPTAPVEPRIEGVTLWTGNQLFVWGGLYPFGRTKNLSDGALYSPSTRTWTRLPPAPLSRRALALGAVVGHWVVIWGGGENPRWSDGARFDLETHRWSVLPPPPIARAATAQYSGALTTWDGRAVLLVPRVGPRADAVTDVAAYDPRRNSWTALPSIVTPGRGNERLFATSTTAFAVDGTLHVWRTALHVRPATQGTEVSSPRTQALRLDATNQRWVNGDIALPPQFSGEPTQVLGTTVLFPTGGSCPCRPGSVSPYSPYEPLLPLLIDARTGRRTSIPPGPLGATGREIFWTGRALLSYDPDSNLFIDVRKRAAPGELTVWDAGTGRWSWLPSAPGAARATTQPVDVWTGRELIVWGLYRDDASPVGTGGVVLGPK